jgi:hypothetical protein
MLIDEVEHKRWAVPFLPQDAEQLNNEITYR